MPIIAPPALNIPAIEQVLILEQIFMKTIDPKSTTTSPLIEALIRVESADKNHPNGNDNAIGDKKLKNHAYGVLQIRQPAVDDVNQVLGTSYKAQDCLGNRALSILIFNTYMSIYATEKQLGRPVTDEDRARIWNGGPNGWKYKPTIVYWSQAKKHLA